ncbi:hypothetical protein F511_36245 [Dorcoceras hygrometricum]|uniref:FHA domain-containing protein n=1 Tax=Dorcoceras hygrometricum TaxID=472368 RepID=A0A2Z7BV77_9LAMI|nr:hypothetical protein F511_36245 [Dorcoceras hygrometricum]
MAEDERLPISEAYKPNSTPDGPDKISDSSNPKQSRNLKTSKEFISSVAARIADQPLQCFAPEVWGVLTAISEKARQRYQGLNMPLTCDEHVIGRLVDDTRFRITAPAVSATHCKIYRKKVAAADTMSDVCCSVFLKDSSTNGTYLNWDKLIKSGPEVKLCHGDIISIAVAPHHEHAFAFVFREAQKSSVVNDGQLKRKPEELGAENKRLKGIGIGALHGPVSLDDFRSLEKSNKELRKLLEDQLAITEALHSDNRSSTEKHESEMRELRESISKSYQSQFNVLNHHLEAKKKDLAELNRTFAEQRHEMENLNKRLIASKQSCVEANEIIDSQKASLSELKSLLDEERDQRRGEREKAAANFKLSIQRIQAETAEEIKRVSDGAVRREKEQQEMINKLQEDTRQKLVDSDNKVSQLEGQIHEELLASARSRELIKEIELEKAAREEAWAKVSALELEISAALRDLDFERRRLKGARERIMLRETQLRAFYSTTEEISVLFVKQQEQLKAMQRTLEDEENYETTSVDADLNAEDVHVNRTPARDKGTYQRQVKAKVGSGACHSHGSDQLESSCDEASMTEKHDCNVKSRGGGQDTEEVEINSDEHNVRGGFGSDINGTTPILAGDAIGTEQLPETEAVGTSPILEGEVETEHVVETESQSLSRRLKLDLNKFRTSDEMQIDDEKNSKAPDQAQNKSPDPSPLSHSNSPLAIQNPMEDTEGGGSIKTGDLLASEVLGSWAFSTAPSGHGENDSPRSRNDEEGMVLPVQDSNSLVAESQHIPSSKSDAIASDTQNLMLLCEMITIISPDSKEQFRSAVIRDDRVGCDGLVSSSETEDCGNKDEAVDEAGSGGVSDTETVDRDGALANDEMEEDDDDTQEDTVG